MAQARAGSRTDRDPGTPRGRRRAAEIADAAAQVFARRGYHGASTQEIADLLGMRQASLYYYFPSKEAALEEVCRIGVEGFVEAAQAIAAGGSGPAEKLTALMIAHTRPVETRAGYVRVFLNERRHLPADSRRRIGRKSRRLERIFEAVLQEGAEAGLFREDTDPRLCTLAILGMLNGVPAWYGKEKRADVDRIVAAFARLTLDGVLAAPRQGGAG